MKKNSLTFTMYSRSSVKTCRDIPCVDNESHLNCCPNYVYSKVEDLAELEMPESFEMTWFRTVGILQSFHGSISICGMNSTGGIAIDKRIQVVYLQSTDNTKLQSIVMPCPVQIFGSIKWNGRKPVVYTKLIQVLTASKALQLKDIMDRLVDFKVSKSVINS